MRRILLLVTWTALCLASVCTSMADDTMGLPVRTQAAIELQGKTYECTSEYWAEPCIVANNRNDQPGMHQEFLQLQRELKDATAKQGLEAQGPYYTSRSLPILKAAWQDERRLRAGMKDATVTTKPRDIQGQVYLVVRFVDEAGEHFVMARNPSRVAPAEESGPEFPVLILSKEDGRWRFDLLMHEHVIVKAVRTGAWKQFGAPGDVTYKKPRPAQPDSSQK